MALAGLASMLLAGDLRGRSPGTPRRRRPRSIHSSSAIARSCCSSSRWACSPGHAGRRALGSFRLPSGAAHRPRRQSPPSPRSSSITRHGPVPCPTGARRRRARLVPARRPATSAPSASPSPRTVDRERDVAKATHWWSAKWVRAHVLARRRGPDLRLLLPEDRRLRRRVADDHRHDVARAVDARGRGAVEPRQLLADAHGRPTRLAAARGGGGQPGLDVGVQHDAGRRRARPSA